MGRISLKSTHEKWQPYGISTKSCFKTSDLAAAAAAAAAGVDGADADSRSIP